MHSKHLVVLLAYNEEACIAETISEVRRVVPGVDVLVVDDGSADATAVMARRAGAVVVSHPFNLGVAAGEATGLLFAERHGYAALVRIDGDGQHDPAFIAPLLARVDDGADLVIGSRFAGLQSFRSTGLRRFGNQFLARLLTTLCKRPVTDPTSGFRGFSARAIAFFGETHPHDYPEPESILMAARQGFRIDEVPVQMRPRRTGTSSLTPWRSAFYMIKVSFALLLERVRTT
ncbi:glycosyltransferase family 2 protein [Pyxidicoccus caerfyrddinensis]|uniref:glycosyltransferase family 2 protein n=1 Tax=Pyxidicoccus caerfyrddinensis TaxID=2709663 RepID=UPI0013D8E529|nr:glycosyltransferase family 2 protein [Pyxidicoccus caerfyrddinensis]